MKRYVSHKEVDSGKVDGFTFIDGVLEIAVNGEHKPYRYEGEVALRIHTAMERHPDDLGYLVVYAGDYTSWSPSEQFETGYTEIDTDPTPGVETVHDKTGLAPAKFGFENALFQMRKGHRVAREGWNGKGMFIFITEGREVPNNKERSFAHFEGDTVTLASHIDMKAADGAYVSGWLASQTDLLAEDWVIVE